MKAKNELQNVGKVSFYSLSPSILVLSFLILSCWFGKGFSISSGHSKLRSLVGMSFLNQLTYIVFFIFSAEIRRCNQKISLHHDLFVLRASHRSILSFKDFFHLVCLSICLHTSKAIPCSGSYFMITIPWHPLSCSVSSYSFLYLLPLDLNRRSPIVLDSSTWSWPLTQDPFRWTLFVNGKTLTSYV
jgi:hypothetical protein